MELLLYSDMYRDGHVLLQGTWGPCSVVLLGVWWAKLAGVLWLWNLQVPIRIAELIELRHFQENIADRDHSRSVLVLVKSAPVRAS